MEYFKNTPTLIYNNHQGASLGRLFTALTRHILKIRTILLDTGIPVTVFFVPHKMNKMVFGIMDRCHKL